MIPEPIIFLSDWTVRAGVLSGGSLLAAKALRNSSAASRHFALRCGLAASILLPLGMWTSANFSPSLPPPAVSSIRPILSESSPLPVSEFQSGMELPPPSQPPSTNPWTIVEIIYLGGVVACVARWGYSFGRIYKISRSAYTHSAQHDYLVCKDPLLSVPLTFGVLNPVILLPAEAVDWPSDRLESVLLHECSHIARRDWPWLTLASLFNAIHWFNPIGWMLTSSLRSTSEESADDHVLQKGVSPSMYANQLLYFASNARTQFSSSLSMARTGHISSRLKRILNSQIPRTDIRPAKAVALATAFAASGLVFANYGGVTSGNHSFSLPVAVRQGGHGVARWSDGTEADIQLITNGSSVDEVGWDADGAPVDPSTISKSGSISMSTSDTSKRLIAIYYAIKNYAADEGSSLDHIKTRLVGSQYMGGSSSNGVSISGSSGSQGGTSNSSNSSSHDSNPPNLNVSGGQGRGIAGGSGRFGGGAGGGGNRGQVMRAFAVPNSLTTSSLQLGKGLGPYQQVSQSQGGSSAWAVKETPSVMKLGTSENVNGVTKEGTQQVTSTKLSFTLPEGIPDQDWRIIAYAADGTKLTMMNSGSGPAASQSAVKLYQAQVLASAAQISKIVLESRPLEWVTIPNVALTAHNGAQP
jgi:hypothetical protein